MKSFLKGYFKEDATSVNDHINAIFFIFTQDAGGMEIAVIRYWLLTKKIGFFILIFSHNILWQKKMMV